MPIIVGAPRSGTTLLRLMLDSHPDLAIPPETGFLAIAGDLSNEPEETMRETFFRRVTRFPEEAPGWDDFGIDASDFWKTLMAIQPFSIADGYRAFYRTYAARAGKSRWGDKTPTYTEYLATIQRVLPEARFVHVIRDGRDVALSLRHMWFTPGRDIESLARTWRRSVTTARAQAPECRHYLEVRFEALIVRPVDVLSTVCAFLDLSYSESMLDYHRRAPARLAEHRSRFRTDGTLVVSHETRLAQQSLTMRPPETDRVGVWSRDMNEDEQSRFRSIAGDLLEVLGYPC
jgi:hypothetical protein